MLFLIGRRQRNIRQKLLELITWRQQLAYHTENSTYYETLGVSMNATQAEIKRAYYERSKELHPDKTNCTSEQELKRRNDAFIELTTAYEILKSPERRQSYDISLNGSTNDDRIEWSSFDGLFTDSLRRRKKKPTSLIEMYYGFWENFGVFGECLRFLAHSLAVSVILLGIMLQFLN